MYSVPIHEVATRSLAIALLMAMSATAYAQSDRPATARDQLDDDVTAIPRGLGAILVPSLTTSRAEPSVLVYHRDTQVASGRTGERIVLPPGHYRIFVGHGPVLGRASSEVDVAEGVSTPILPFFGALRVAIVDASGKPIDDEYTVVAKDGGLVLGPAATSDRGQADAPTWLLRPGVYVLALGSDADAKESTTAFLVSAGAVLRYRLVVDGGSLIRTELGDGDVGYEASIWRLRWIVGGSASLTQQSNAFSGFAGSAVIANLFTSFEGGIDAGDQLALLTIHGNQSFLGLDSEHGLDSPLQPLVNDADAELLYNYRASRIAGPYVRAIARTSFFSDYFTPETDSTIVTSDESGAAVATESVLAGNRTTTFGALAPTSIQEGAGLSLTAFDNRVGNLTVRGGVAARQAYYRGGRFFTARNGARVDMLRVDDREGFGGELTAIGGLRLSRTLSYETRLDSFVPKEQVLDGDELVPVFRWDNTLALRLNGVASLVYTFSLRRDEVIVPELQTSQGLTVQLQYAFF